jgi:hypothetical protein
VPLDDLVGGPDRSNPTGTAGRPPAARGKVSRAPASAQDSMGVTLVNFTATYDYEVPASNWRPRVAVSDGALVLNLPARDDRALVVFDDDGDAWVPEWGAAS